MAYADQEEVFDRLERLSEYETVSSFALAYYELIADYLAGDSRRAHGLRLCFLEFLEAVARYHRAIDVLASEDRVTLGNVRSASEKRDIALTVLLEQLAADEAGDDPEIGRLLLSAECYYQLALVDRVVDRLEAAVAIGADHPLVQFALGYNRYELATQAFTRYSAETGRREIDDEDRFRLACLSAVSAFQDGLAADVFDGHIHWWIGNVLKAAGFEDAARASFDKAAEILSEPDAPDLHDVADVGLEWSASVSFGAAEETGPITEEEVQQAGLLLRRSFSASDLMSQ